MGFINGCRYWLCCLFNHYFREVVDMVERNSPLFFLLWALFFIVMIVWTVYVIPTEEGVVVRIVLVAFLIFQSIIYLDCCRNLYKEMVAW